jgi:hypothetical protein
MSNPNKEAMQSLIRRHEWAYHLVIPGRDVMRMGDQGALSRMKELNFGLCKRRLGRKFASFPLDERFHWLGIFQGRREFGSRHLHVLLYVPSAVPSSSSFQQLRLSQGIQSMWLRVRDHHSALWLWNRRIDGDADNKAVATYVSRELTGTSWAEDVHFSQ